jgi:hypothetical protein
MHSERGKRADHGLRSRCNRHISAVIAEREVKHQQVERINPRGVAVTSGRKPLAAASR